MALTWCVTSICRPSVGSTECGLRRPSASGEERDMDHGIGMPSRRAFLAGALGTAGLVVAGCNKPTVSDLPPSHNQSATSSQDAAQRPEASASTTSARPRPHRPSGAQTASASMMIKRATVPVLCYHQLREWRSGDSQYNRTNLICPPRYFRAHLDALVENGWTTISPDQYLAHLATGAA